MKTATTILKEVLGWVKFILMIIGMMAIIGLIDPDVDVDMVYFLSMGTIGVRLVVKIVTGIVIMKRAGEDRLAEKIAKAMSKVNNI